MDPDIRRSGSARRYAALSAGLVIALTGCSSTPAEPTSLTFAANPCLPADTVALASAQALRIDCGAGGTTVTLTGNGASYLIVPEFATDQEPNQYVEYAVASGELAATAPLARRASGAPASPTARVSAYDGRAVPTPGAMQREADRLLLARAGAAAASGAFRGARLMRAAPPATPPAPGSMRTFHVLTSLSVTPTWTTVGAQLAYVGSGVLLYVDTLAPANGFTAAQFQTFGQYFDQVLLPLDTAAFGPPTDLDGNGAVIMLMSPVINAVTPAATCTSQGYVAGFFESNDFNTGDPNSNDGEVFYSIVPDPLGIFSCAHSAAEVDGTLPAVYLHELEHLINFSQHVIVNGGAPGSSWLDEGLAIAGEELGSLHYEQQCPPPACRTDPAQLFPDSSQAFIQSLLYDSYQFALLPDTASITLGDDADQGFAWRGGAWLLVRWLGDQFGGGLYRQLERGPSNGISDIESATGQSFPSLFADFGLALYTDSLPGLPRTTAPAMDRFTSRNVSALWARLYTTTSSATIPVPRPVQLFAVTGDTASAVMVPGTVTYFRLDTPATANTVAIRFAGPGGAAFPAALKAQLAIFRLPPGQ